MNFFRVYLASGAQLADVKRGILERYAGQRQVFVLARQNGGAGFTC